MNNAHRTLMLAVALKISMFFCAPAPIANAQVAPTLVKQGKHATALVVLPESDGSAFCISTSGFFITNAHVVEEIKPGQTVTLVLNPGEADESKVQASLIRSDAELDLALLRVDKPRALTALPLGDIDELVETTPVAAFGYPFGKDLALKNQEFPSVTVSTGHITALRKLKGQVQLLQLDASLNPGNSGGPVINSSGKVVGIVQAGIDGTNVNIAIPITALQKFLSAVQLTLSPMNIAPALMSREQDLTIQLLPLLKSFDNPTVQVKLTVYKHATREFTAVASGPNTYKIHAVPVPPGEINSFVKISIRDKDKDYFYHIKDVPISVGRVRLNLGDLQCVEPQTNKAVNNDGREFIGAIGGLTSLVAENHGTESILNFSRVSKMLIERLDPDIRSLDYEVVVKQGANVVLDSKGEIPLGAVPAEKSNREIGEGNSVDPPAPVDPRFTTFQRGGITYVPSNVRESMVATFKQADGGISSKLYSGLVLLTVSGVGQAESNVSNDAFYRFDGPDANSPRIDSYFDQLTFGTTELSPSPANNATRKVVSGTPPYNPSHVYTFILDTGVTVPTRLHFGVGDRGFDDNTGFYKIRIIQMTPAR